MIHLNNTLTRKKESLVPPKGKRLNLFVCGPTVYDLAHIGHARTYLFFDAFVKFLRKEEYDVFYLQNITDIDDKIITRAKEEGVNPSTLAQKFEKEYLKDMEALQISAVTKYARATDHIKEIIKQTETLLEKGFAYVSEDGVYYDISKFKDYGKLSGRTISQAEDGISRIDDGVKKRNKGDFCLWKFSSPREPRWESPWKEGRPGWHIEDTAIAEKYFGPQYDIHGGARDLVFPHHEAEIAQMEAVSGKIPFVKLWMHTGFLTVKGKKMSKSLGNFITVRSFLKNHSPRILRMMVLKTHYKSPIDYTIKAADQAKRELQKIDGLLVRLEEITGDENRKEKSHSALSRKRKELYDFLRDDFDTPSFFAAFFRFIADTNTAIDKNKVSPAMAQGIIKLLEELDEIFHLFTSPVKERFVQKATGDLKKVKQLAEKRKEYREKKEWKMADKIRKEIEKLGYHIEDINKDYKIKKYE